MQDNNQITVTVLSGFDGGFIVYETVIDEPTRLVFGGNLDEVSTYLTGRMKGLIEPAKPSRDAYARIDESLASAPVTGSYAGGGGGAGRRSLDELLREDGRMLDQSPVTGPAGAD